MKRISVVLYHSIYARNVGMCARAMANMDISRLVLISPRCDHLSEEGKQGAAHAQSVLRGATVYGSHQDFLKAEGEGIRLALSGRDGRLKRPERLDRVLDHFLEEPGHAFQKPETPVYLIFGPEDDGLSNEEMELSHSICRLPTLGEITSLNLSHAVLLTSYMVQTAIARAQGRKAAQLDTAMSGPSQLEPAYYPSETIKKWLESLGFDLSAPRVTIEKTLNRIFLSRCPAPDELRLLDTVLQQTVRKLQKPE